MNIIQVEASRVTKLSVTYVKHRPILLAVIPILFLVHVFLQSLFVLLVFVIPIIIFITVSFRLIFHIHQQNLKSARGDTNTNESSSRKLNPGCVNLDKSGHWYRYAQSVRQRKSKNNEIPVQAQEDMHEKDMNFINESALVDKEVMVEETPKEIQEVRVEPMIDRSRANKLYGENLGSEEAPRDGNKVVEWTDNDRKNVMDLGFSEIERSKRLESLIAKRKERKLLSLQVRRTLMNIGRNKPYSEMSSLLVPKTGSFSKVKLGEKTPGSAPSVLVPVHNPFDLPYDPQEEKPNLSGGFQEDLLVSHHNDAVFCRHESFILQSVSPGPWDLDSPTETSHHPNFDLRPKCLDIPEFSRFKKQSGKEDLVEIKNTRTSQESKNMALTDSSLDPIGQSEAPEKALNLNDVCKGEVTNIVKDDSKLDTYDIHESSSSSSSEINSPFSATNRDEILRSLSVSFRKNTPVEELDTNVGKDDFSNYENPSRFVEKRGDDPFCYDYKQMYNFHKPLHSIASDLQVEISEVSSQVTNLSSDGESPKYDVDVNEGSSGNEEVSIAASQLKKVDKNEANNLVMHQNIVKKPEESLAKKLDKDKTIVNVTNDQVELGNEDQGIIDFIPHTYGEDLVYMDQGASPQDLSAPTLNSISKSADIIKGKSPDLYGNNNSQVIEVVAENDPSQASSSTSSRCISEDKDPSISLEKTTDGIGLVNSANLPRINIVSSEQQLENQRLGSNQMVRTSEFNPSLVRPIEPVMFLGIDPSPIAVIPEVGFEQVADDATSTSSSPISVLQHKFSVDFPPNMSFDDIPMLSQTHNSTIVQTYAGDSVGLQESSFPLSQSTEDITSNILNDRGSNVGTREELVQTSTSRADIGSLRITEKNEKVEILTGPKAIDELQKPKECQGHQKLDITIDKSKCAGVSESHSRDVVLSKVISDADNVVSSDKLSGKMKEVKEFQGHPKLGITIDISESVGVIESHSGDAVLSKVNSDVANRVSPKKDKAIEELQKPKEFECQPKLDISVDKPKPVGVGESPSENLAMLKVTSYSPESD